MHDVINGEMFVCKKCGNIIMAVTPPLRCPYCNSIEEVKK